MIRIFCRTLRESRQITFNKSQLSKYNLHISVAAAMAEKYDKEQLRKRLTPLQYQVTQEKATERPFTGCYNKSYEPGTYVCIVCEQPLFSSDTKYDSGCGWPAFNDVLDQGRVKLSPDTTGGITFLRSIGIHAFELFIIYLINALYELRFLDRAYTYPYTLK